MTDSPSQHCPNCEAAAAEERAKIVAWLRSADRRLLEAPYWADVIEAKEHLK